MRVSDLQHAASVGWKTLRADGIRAALRKGSGAIHQRLGGGERVLGLYPEDIVDSSRIGLVIQDPPVPVGRKLRVGWVMVPPEVGSGGHTTAFRMIEAMEQAGHKNVVFLYDRFGGNVQRHETTIRSGWPNIRCDIVDIGMGMHDVDVWVATSWETAHVIAARYPSSSRRAYFIQDFEPYFYPHGWEYALAEDSYRLGFRCIALGEMVQQTLRREVGIESDVVEFGSDTTAYSLLNRGDRNGVAFFARPGFARRGYGLGKLALEEFRRRNPSIDIHVYGSDAADIAFPVVRHGKLTPTELNALYNRCRRRPRAFFHERLACSGKRCSLLV